MANEDALSLLEQDIEVHGLEPVKQTRAVRSTRSSGGDTMTLREEDGVLHWDFGVPSRVAMRGDGNRAIRTYRFQELPPNQISRKLQELDAWLTPGQGLRVVTHGKIGHVAAPVATGRILLFVHGTFSNCENILTALDSTDSGRSFLSQAIEPGRYDQVLAFNHPTLSVSPFLNALELSRAFADSKAEIDIVCHSRGGLVVRWWLETLRRNDAPVCRVVFVGSPLSGTGLAAPANVRASLDLLASYSSRLATAAGIGSVILPIATPIFQATAVIAGIVSTVSKAGASTPAVDAAMALIPGLAAQSRQGANDEILGLRRGFTTGGTLKERLKSQAQRYHFVTANFETKDTGWAFWKRFRRDHIADGVTNVVFDGPNDLVVDTSSMTDLADHFPALDHQRQIYDFGTTDTVHHCNYFQQEATIAFIEKCLA